MTEGGPGYIIDTCLSPFVVDGEHIHMVWDGVDTVEECFQRGFDSSVEEPSQISRGITPMIAGIDLEPFPKAQVSDHSRTCERKAQRRRTVRASTGTYWSRKWCVGSTGSADQGDGSRLFRRFAKLLLSRQLRPQVVMCQTCKWNLKPFFSAEEAMLVDWKLRSRGFQVAL